MHKKKPEILKCTIRTDVLKHEKPIIGIDPGVSGAFAVINQDHAVLCDFPKIKINNKSAINLPHLKELILQAADPTISTVYIENVHAMPGQGVTSMFTFGCSKGQLEGLCVGLGMDVRFISPQKWKRYFNLLGESDMAVRNAASQFINVLPEYSIHALEALLIAIGGYSTDYESGE